MTGATNTFAPNTTYDGLLLMGFINKGKKKVASSKKHTQLRTGVLKPCTIYNQNGQNQTRTAEKPYPEGLTIPI